LAFWVGGADCGTSGEFGCESDEQAANNGIMAAAATASAFALELHLLVVTPCTVAAAQHLNHRHTD
jgi:hypothetical protein